MPAAGLEVNDTISEKAAAIPASPRAYLTTGTEEIAFSITVRGLDGLPDVSSG